MRLELGTFPVKDVVFGPTTDWKDEILQINKDEIRSAVLDDLRIAEVDLEIAKPGESVRIWPVRDMIDPRIKVDNASVTYPGICGRNINTVGQGRTHRLSGVSILEVSNVNWHSAGGDYVDVFVDMTGPWAQALPHMSSLINICLLVEPDPELGIESQNYAVHEATLKVSDMLAAIPDQNPPEMEVFELTEVDPALPKIVYVMCNHSPQHMSGSLNSFCVATYGLTQLQPPVLLHPNEILDGAVSGPYRTAFATSWAVVNNPILLELYRRHGIDFNLRGVITFKTEWTTQNEKQLMANQCAKLAKMVGAEGAIFTWDAGGNEFIEVIRGVQACEREGIKTVFVTSEDNPEGGAATVLEPLPEANAVVSTGFFVASQLDLSPLPDMERVIGNPEKVIGPLRNQIVSTATLKEWPWRHDDHYGFTRMSCEAY